jgi:hypothetical protein
MGSGETGAAALTTGLTETATTCSALKSNALTRIFTVVLRLKFLINQKESICLMVEI